MTNDPSCWYISKYDTYIMDINKYFTLTNKEFYEYITNIGLEIDLKSKDQQKIYFHFLLKGLFEYLKLFPKNNIIIYSNNWISQDCFCNKYYKKLNRLFKFRIIEDWITFGDFITKFENNEAKYVEIVESTILSKNEPSTYKYIKKFLQKEGFTDLVENYFEDPSNKMLIFHK